MGVLLLLLLNLVALVAAALQPLATDQGPRERKADGATRRGGPQPVGEPSSEDREQIAAMQAEARQRLEAERQAQAEAAEPAGVPPSDDQRQALIDLRQRTAEQRAGPARAVRRKPVAVGVVDDEDRNQVADMLSDARDRQLDELDRRGIVEPFIESQTAGFDPELPHLPGSELYGTFTCPTCGAIVERAFPGYVDWDAASRDVVCSECGGVVRRGGSEAGAPAPSAPPPEDASRRESVQTSAQAPGQTAEVLSTGPAGTYMDPAARQPSAPEGGAAAAEPLSDQERAELEQLRGERQRRQQAEAAPEQHQEAEPTPAEPSSG